MIGALALSLFAMTPPPASNTAFVKTCLSHVQAHKRDHARACFAPEIVWQVEGDDAAEPVVSGAYLIYLAVVGVKIGPIKSFDCRAVDAVEVACTIALNPMYGKTPRQLTERYFVNDGKIVKVASIVPPEVARGARSE